MVVGQYYITQINNELESISSNISQVIDVQNNEYKCKVFALISKVKNLSTFQTKLLENKELRKDEIFNLNYLEQRCIEVLGLVHLTYALYQGAMSREQSNSLLLIYTK
ncbi:MAG: hypothetical protein ACTHWS_12380 [Staphylococcus equorum]